MATPFTHVLAAVASLATVHSVVASSVTAWADETSAVAQVPAELMQWHSGLTVTGGSSVNPELSRALRIIDPKVATTYLVMHGAAGLRVATEYRSDYLLDSFDAPQGTRTATRVPVSALDGMADRVR